MGRGVRKAKASSQRVDTLWHFSDRSLEALLAVLRGQVDAEPVASQWRGLEAFGEFAAFVGVEVPVPVEGHSYRGMSEAFLDGLRRLDLS